MKETHANGQFLPPQTRSVSSDDPRNESPDLFYSTAEGIPATIGDGSGPDFEIMQVSWSQADIGDRLFSRPKHPFKPA